MAVRIGVQLARLGAAMVLCGGVLLGLGVGSASAGTFSVQMCNQKIAPPWQSGYESSVFTSPPYTTGGFSGLIDNCTQTPGTYDLGVGTMSNSQVETVGFPIPAGELLTGVSINLDSGAPASGSIGVQLRVSSEGAVIYNATAGDNTGAQPFQSSFPGASWLMLDMYCSSSSNCSYNPGVQPISIGETDLTLTDTGVPAISSGGGGLAGGGTVSGLQTQIYSASDTGSGVDSVSVALGTTVVATAQSACDYSTLSPCPATANGTLDVDTTQVRNGSYPVILTAYDASGDPAVTQVGTVTVHNAGTLTLPGARIGKRALKASLSMSWGWTNLTQASLTVLKATRLPADGVVKIACAGTGCPYKSRSATAKRLKTLTGKSFAVGDVLTITTSAKGYTSNRVRLRIRSAEVPAVLR